MALSHDIAKDLLDIGAVQIRTNDYFTWTSGIQSPIYCDNRLTMSYPAVRTKIAEGFIQLIEQMAQKPDIIAGCATAGIPHAAWVADRLELPMVYVRDKPKGHGKGNQIEGDIKPGQRIIVIEDLISTGSSSIEAAKALQQEGAQVLEVLAVFTYGLGISEEHFLDAYLNCRTITTYDDILSLLIKDDIITDAEWKQLKTWQHKL